MTQGLVTLVDEAVGESLRVSAVALLVLAGLAFAGALYLECSGTPAADDRSRRRPSPPGAAPWAKSPPLAADQPPPAPGGGGA